MVQVETLHEPIVVRADFRGGQIEPLWFQQGQRKLQVVSVHACWLQRDTDCRRYCFSVQADTGDIFELHLDARDMQWWLDRVCLEG